MAEVASDGRGERASRRRARTREQLLDIAERAFTTSAYQDVRMDDLAEEADISVGSIYGHFASKDGLYLALRERAVEQMAVYLGQGVRPEYSPLERVMACGDAYLRFHLEHPGLFRFLAFDRVAPTGQSDGLHAGAGARLAEVITWFEGLVAEAIDSGEADAGYDARLVSRFLWAAWNGVVALSLRGDELALTDDEVAACLQMGRRLVNEGLTAPAHRDEAGRSRVRLVDTSASA